MTKTRALLAAACVLSSSCSLLVGTDDFSGEAEAPADASAAQAESGGDPASDAGPGGPGDADPGDAGADPDPDLIADWSFDEGTGALAADRSGRGHDGLVTDGTWVDGRFGKAIELGPSGRVLVGATSAFDRPAGADFTVTSWIRLSAAPSHGFVLSVSFGPSNAAFGLEVRDETHINYFAGETDAGPGAAHVATSQVPLSIGTWAHVALVVDAGAVKLYFEGVAVGSGVADETPREATQLLLGASNYGTQLPAALDNVRVYRRALSATEIQADRLR